MLRVAYLAMLFSAVASASPMLETLNYVRFYPATDPKAFTDCSNTNGVACDGSVKHPDQLDRKLLFPRHSSFRRSSRPGQCLPYGG